MRPRILLIAAVLEVSCTEPDHHDTPSASPSEAEAAVSSIPKPEDVLNQEPGGGVEAGSTEESKALASEENSNARRRSGHSRSGRTASEIFASIERKKKQRQRVDSEAAKTSSAVGSEEGARGAADVIDADATSYTLSRVEDMSHLHARRVSARIVIPLGRSRELVESTLERAARDVAEREDAKAAMVFAYRPSDTPTGAYTVGRAIYAPNGQWEDARKNDPAQVSVEIGELYFEDPVDAQQEGDVVRLGDGEGGMVLISGVPDAWDDESIVARVPTGTKAKVLERQAFALTSDYEIVRFRVTVIGGDCEGWVFESDIDDL